MLLKKIVVAEDDDAIAHMVNMALGDAGFLCLRARDGEEALNIVRMHAPDLLVLDVMMPRLDGMEVARRIKSDVILSRTPILMLTALGDVDNKVDGFEAGADDYLVKPFDLREFAARVKALIRAASRERERNPTTELPGSNAVESHIIGLLGRDQPVAVIHVDIRDFDRYADGVGINKAEALVAELGTLVLEKTRAHSGGTAFVGHLGGADFISVAPAGQGEALAGALIDGFERRRPDWIETGPDIPPVGMAIAVASTEGLSAADGTEQLAVRLATAMREAKQSSESCHVLWKPKAT
jgi:CheY-like chemotaxis protein